MPNLNEYYQLLQKEEPPLSNNALREMLASAMERADKEALDEALAAPQATASVRRSRLHGTGIVASTAAIITLSFWGFTYFQSQQSSAPRVQQETVQSGKNEAGTVGNATTTEENTSRSTGTQYNAQQTDQFLQPPFAAISHTTRPQTNSGVMTTVADTITKNNITQTEPSPADSLLPEDFRSWEMPSYLAWAVAQRRYGTARTIIDSMLHNGQHSVQSEYNLYCLRGHLSKAMDSVEASITDYSQALSFQESSALYMQRGTQYFTASKRQEAYDDFTSAMRLDPKNYQAVYMRGAAAYNLKRFEEACDDWYLAAQMGHPFADSVLEQRCASFMPKYVRTAQAERLQKIKTLSLLLDRVKQGIDYFPTSFMHGDQLHSFDSLSYKSLSPSCSISAILIGNASTYCALHTIYTLALEFNDVPLALLIKSLGLKPRNSPNLLSKNQVVNNLRADDAYSQYQIIESQKSLPKSSTAPSPNTNVGFQRIPTGNGIADKLGRTQEQRLLQREMQIAFQQIEEYCRATYPEMAVQAPSSLKTETTVQTLSPPAQQDTAHTLQTSMSTTDSRTDEASVLAPIVPDTKKTLQSTNNSISYSAPQTTLKSTITVAKPTEKPHWQYGKRLYQQQYSVLDQLTQIALSQVGVKTTFSQLLAPCTLSAALDGKSSSDCVLSLLEQYASQIQDSTLQAHAILAQRYRNYQMPTTPKASEPSTPPDTYKSIPVSTLPRTLESARNPVHEEILVVRVVEEMPKSTSEPAKPNDDAFVYLYPQVLLNIQKHTWEVLDAIEDTTGSRPHAERESNATKDIENMPIWFQELVQARRYAFARNLIDSMLTQESRTAELYTLRGDMNKAMDSVEASIADYSQALSFQESSALYMQRGTQYFTASKRQEAYDDFTSAMRLDPKNYQAVYMRGAAAYNLKRFEEACDDWYLAAQMGHPFADSVLEQRCASFMPKYVRTAIVEKKQQVKTMLLLLEQINSRSTSWNTQKLDSLPYKSLEVNCTMENALDGSISSACILHLLYTLTLNLHDDIASDFVKRLAERGQKFALSSPATSVSPNLDQTMRSIDFNKQIVDKVSNINSTPNRYEEVQSLQNLQRLQSQAMDRRAANTFRNATAQSSHSHVAGIIEQMKKYLLIQYAEFLDSK
ncbi:MAG: tetratricopeptide repeat protein [Ignavibacteria bacterium]|nr:tetratricopeptide repeat protein [Ignavibacteria bacterium]